MCVNCALGLVKAPLKRSRSTADGGDEESQDQLQELLESGAMDEEQKTDNTTLLRLLEEGEKVRQLASSSTTQYSHLIQIDKVLLAVISGVNLLMLNGYILFTRGDCVNS